MVFFKFIRFIAVLLESASLGKGIDRTADMHFRHEPAEVLCVVCQVIELGGVEIKHLATFIGGGVASIENHVQRLAAAQGD
jgi:hypothetical protein